MKKSFLPFLLATFALLSPSIGQSFFKLVTKAQSPAESGTFFPKKYDAYTLDEKGLRNALEAAPWEFTAEASQQRCIVELPTAQGGSERFSVFRVAMLDDELAAAYPEIRTYAGTSLADPRLTVRFSVTPRGFRALVLRPDFSAAYVRPVDGEELYIAYEHADASAHGMAGMRTGIAPDGTVWYDDKNLPSAPEPSFQGKEIDPVRLKIFRYCAAATGEFTQDHGGTKPLSLAAVTEYTNQVSAIFERDMALRLQLTNATQYVIFTDPNTDPYNAGQTVQDYMFQNPSVLNFYTNFNSHDVGHVYTRYITGGAIGVAGGLGVACGTNKAAGCSAGVLGPTGDYGSSFLVVIGQEVGHQLGGGHTWNRCNGGDGRQGLTAFEPGSGSTIMSYAGACGPDNIQFNSDLYFHSGSIEEIKNYFTFIATCGSWQTTTNNPPVVTLNYPSNFSIPVSTPFELDGSATDADGDPLNYAWEGIDTGPETPLGQPQGNTAIFRTWPAVNVTNRYFPRLSTILANGFSAAEQLPAYTRDLSFRLTARDNKPNGGGVGWADVFFKASASAGPFLVTSPNSASDIWRIGELTQVQWDVANTDAAPVNCKKVNIRLSTDGGLTYPITLIANTENDGSHYVEVPDLPTSLARVRVEAADNVFFDLSNANFKIQAPAQPSLTLGLSADAAEICLPDNFVTEVLSASVLGYSAPVSLDLLGTLPAGATASFSSPTIVPGSSSTLTVNLTNVAVEGTFNLSVRAISGTDTLLRPIQLSLRRNDFTGFALLSPANGTTEAPLIQTLRWGKGLDAKNYDVQFSDSPAFAQILASANGTSLDSFKINFLLQKGKAYYWRVRPKNDCGTQPWSEPFFFSTLAENCLSFTANDLPKSISANGTPTIESKINVFQGAQLSDLVVTVSGYHEYFRDLEATIVSPQGTEVVLFKNRCANYNGSFNFGMSDAAPLGFVCPPPTNGAINRPQTPLASIIGQNSTGTWTLRVKDGTSSSGGSLNNFGLQFCQTLDLQPPFLIKNEVMPLPSGTNQAITPDYLLVGDPNNPPDELIFTVVTSPKHGALAKTGAGDLQPGDQFTQADINAGLIRFYDYGYNADPDGFRFVVTDGEGGFYGTPLFVVQPLVSTSSPYQQLLEFSVFPNPAEQATWLAFGQKGLEAPAVASIFNMSGQLVSSDRLPQGTTQWQLNLGQLPKGIYMIRVESAARTGIRKLVLR